MIEEMIGQWLIAETLPPIAANEVQVWRIELPDESTALEAWTHLLTDEERARAERLRAGLVRMQFVVARTCLRMLLGNCLATDPASVSIRQSNHGKPETDGLFFNVAHSGRIVLIALCLEHRVGVDVEYISREVDALEIARNSFAEREYRELASIPDAAQRRLAFFRCWARKEATVKADGRGLSIALASFEVPVAEPALASRIRFGRTGTYDSTTFYVSDLTLGDDLAAALALSSTEVTARGFFFPKQLLLS